MKRSIRIAGVAATAVAAAAQTAGAVPAQKQGQKQAPRPNVIMILSDDHSAPYLGCYGNPDIKSPNIDRLAAEGARFNYAFDCAPQSVPSRASIMTGRNPVDVRMLRFSAPLAREYVTYPEIMRKAGYYVGVCGRVYHLDGTGGDAPESREIIKNLGLITFPDRYNSVTMESDDKVAGRVETFLGQVPQGSPFCLWVNYSDPHFPWTAKEFEPDPAKITVPTFLPDVPAVREGLAGHYGEIMRVDSRIGDLMAVLKKHNLMDKTIILFMGDNGAAFPRGKGSLYDCGLHVPLIVRYPPMVKAGTVSDILVSAIDVAPTLLTMTGLKPDPQMEGVSFLPALKGDTAEIHKYAFGVRLTHASSLPTSSAAFDISRSVFNKDYKLIYNAIWQISYQPIDISGSPFWTDLVKLHDEGKLDKRFDRWFAPQRPMFELYDMKADPDEFVNLYGDPRYAQVEHDLKYALAKFMITYHDIAPTPFQGGKKGKGGGE